MALVRLIVAFLFLCAAAFPMPALAAASDALVRADPAASVVSVGQTATITIRLENATDVYGIDVRLGFDPTAIEIIDADSTQAGVQILAGTFPYPDFTVRNVVEPVTGTVHYASVQLNPRAPASGAGAVFSFQVRGKTASQSTLAIQSVEMADRNGTSLPVRTQAATIQVTAGNGAPQPTATATVATVATVAPTQAAQPTATSIPQLASTPLPTATAILPTVTAPAAGQPTALASATRTAPAAATAAPAQPTLAAISPAQSSPQAPTSTRQPVSASATVAPSEPALTREAATVVVAGQASPTLIASGAARGAIPAAPTAAVGSGRSILPTGPAASAESSNNSLPEGLTLALGAVMMVAGVALLVGLIAFLRRRKV